MIFLIIAAILLTIYAGWITWKYMDMRGKLRRIRDHERELEGDLEKQRAIRQNLQRICDGRGAELRRLRAQQAEHVAAIRELEAKASELNVSLFRESGLRTLAEKEDSAKRMRVDLLEKQLEEAQRKLKEHDAQALNAEKLYQNIIAEREAELAKLQTSRDRRAARRARANAGMDQISLDDLLSDAKAHRGGKHRGRKDMGGISEDN